MRIRTRNLALAFLLSVLAIPAAFSEENPEKTAIKTFNREVREGTLLEGRIADLKRGGMERKTGATRANLVEISCGIAGCQYRYLVTSLYTSGTVNTQGSIAAAIIAVSSYTRLGLVEKVLDEKDLQTLLLRR